MPRELKEHDLDVAWIIALWLSIHDGDPPPEGIAIDEITGDLVQTLTSHLARTHPDLGQNTQTLDSMQARMKKLGFEVSQTPPSHLEAFLATDEGPTIVQPPPYCITYQGQTICIVHKRVTLINF